jgi:hypothetical protein
LTQGLAYFKPRQDRTPPLLEASARPKPTQHPINPCTHPPPKQVLSWGGYSFVINLMPIFCLACVATGRMNGRHYLAFAPLTFMGTLLAGEEPVPRGWAS